ncbi:histidine--tRNA ligase [Candidatus Uhrbacteria bacterium]|nr:histidine--tRNA ligase [Candidatus Uhrbacteria bacterium]
MKPTEKQQKAPPPTPPPAPQRKIERVQAVRGMKDILPQEERLWTWITGRARALAHAYGFQLIELPILEATSLFVRAVGKDTDIVEKEMFSFEDQGGDRLSLRPEPTAGMVRSYIEHGMVNQPQPVQLYTIGPMFRHERPQAGRLRQFYQFDCEVFGDASPVIDAQLIILAHHFYKELGLETIVHMNSVGCPTCRPTYTEELARYYKTHRKSLCEDCQRRLLKNPLRLLDCKAEACQPIKTGAPQILDRLCDLCKNHFMKVLEYLDDAAIPYSLQPALVRGLDYYTKTVFEFFSPMPDGTQGFALGGGGRYDGLVEYFSQRQCPAAGFGIGLERIMAALRQRTIDAPASERPHVFLAQLGDAAKRRALLLFEECRKANLLVLAQFSKDNLKAQLEIARRNHVRYTLILGQKEVMEGTIILRDMDGGAQEVVNAERIVAVLQKKIAEAPIIASGATDDTPHDRSLSFKDDPELAEDETEGDAFEQVSDGKDTVNPDFEEKGGDDGGSETETE